MEPSLEPTDSEASDITCKCSLDFFNYLLICWSIGFFWGWLGKFTGRNIGRRRDEVLVAMPVRPES